jgi:hypothetical protein
MKHIHIVNPYRSIAMARMSMPLMSAETLPLVYEVTESETPNSDADLNYFLPWHGLGMDEAPTTSGKNVIAYTLQPGRCDCSHVVSRAAGIGCVGG